jgi:hypothetical protein
MTEPHPSYGKQSPVFSCVCGSSLGFVRQDERGIFLNPYGNVTMELYGRAVIYCCLCGKGNEWKEDGEQSQMVGGRE